MIADSDNETDFKGAGQFASVDTGQMAGPLQGLLEGTDSGLALFDADLKLIYANARYNELFGYSASEAKVGVTLQTLARISLRATNTDPLAIDATIQRGIDRLRIAGGFSFRFTAPSGDALYVHRRVLGNGQLVETARQVMCSKEDAEDLQMAMMANAARSRLAHALESMADGFALFDADDRIVAYNQQYVDLNPLIADVIAPGRRYEDMLRLNIERSSPNSNGMSDDDFIAWRLEQHRNPGEPHEIQMDDGRWIKVHERRTPDGGTVGIRTDITELKERERQVLEFTDELRRKNIHFEAALDNMVQGLCMFAPDQTLIVCNKRYLEMYGFSPDVVKPGIKLHEIMEYSVSIGNYTREDADRAKAERPDHARQREQATLKQRLSDGRVIAVLHQPMADGTSIATYQDITDLERSQQRLAQYTRQLEVSNRELQDFAYVASHDLQEPLRKIETFGDRLLSKYSDDLPEAGQKYVERMQNATSRMRLLINDLLSYSRVTTNAKPFNPIDLNACLDGVVGDLQIRIEESDAQVLYEGLPTVSADGTQMRQLLQNLVGNALKFQRPGVKPVVKVTARILAGDLLDEMPSMCELRISDNGIGFDNKYKAQIFTIFQRLHGRNEYEGTGIGLATVRKIVERHNGMIDADGVEGEGATFIVTLPLKQKNEETAD